MFFEDGDYALYLDLLAEAAARAQVAIWAYCLMPNHVHIIAVPGDEEGLGGRSRVHRHYTGYINARMRVTGHLWQGRFSSVAMDETHLVGACAMWRSIRCGRAWTERAEDWPWSSTAAHLAGADNGFVTVAPALERVGDFAAFLSEQFDEAMSYAALRKAESVGRPVGSKEWLAEMEARTGLTIAPRKRGPVPKIR